jgi:hypothetical protein
MKRELEKPILLIAIPKIESIVINKVLVGSANQHNEAVQKKRKAQLNIQNKDLAIKAIRIIRALKNLKNRRYFLNK